MLQNSMADPLDLNRILPQQKPVTDMPMSEQDGRDNLANRWLFREGGATFNFQNGRLLYNNQDLAKFMSENLNGLAANYWMQLAPKLKKYRDFSLKNLDQPEQVARLSGLIQAFLAKILGRAKKKFDEMIDGVSFHLEGGQFFLNGLNVHAVLRRMRQESRSDKTRIFVKGLRDRLLVLLSNRSANNDYEKVRPMVSGLVDELDQFLEAEFPLLPPI